jgi:hypothetical protein
MMLVASRVDAAGDGDRLARLREFSNAKGLTLHEISSVTGEGLEALKEAIWRRLQEIPKPEGQVIE